MPKFTLVLGRQTLKVYDLDQPVIKIGRVGEMDIVIDNVSVSRHQADIRKEAGSWVVLDMGSSNGTFVNGERLTKPRTLQAGDEISMGKFSVFFERVLGDVAPTATGAQRVAAAPSTEAGQGTMFLKADEVQKLQQMAAQKRQAQLVWEIKGQRGTHYLPAAGAALVGSDELCDLQVAGAPNHVLVVRAGEGYEVRNLCTFRGMTVKGNKTVRARLQNGDVIEVGGLKLTFKDEVR